MALIAIMVVGFILAGVTQLSLPDAGSGNGIVAALIGLDGAFTGAYFARQFLIVPGLGSTLFLSLLVATALLAAYRGAFLQSIARTRGAAGIGEVRTACDSAFD